jgi:hypothetical protein
LSRLVTVCALRASADTRSETHKIVVNEWPDDKIAFKLTSRVARDIFVRRFSGCDNIVFHVKDAESLKTRDSRPKAFGKAVHASPRINHTPVYSDGRAAWHVRC